jgi:membrane protease YdiL (CAAX protease family)
MTKIDIMKNAIVFLFVYMLPFIIFAKFWRERHKGKILLIVIGGLYIVISLYTQNLLPFVFVIFNIKYLKSADSMCDVFKNENVSFGDYSKRTISSKVRGDYERFKFSLKKFNLLKGIIFASISYVVVFFISVFESILLSNFKIQPKPQEVVTLMTNTSLGKFLIMLPIVVVFAPVFEEFVFRWLLFEKVFKPRIGIYFSAILSSLIFGFVHFNLGAFPILVWIGLYNCYLINKKGYWYSVFNHLMFNSLTTTILLLGKLGITKF